MNYLIDVHAAIITRGNDNTEIIAFTILGSLPLGILLSFGWRASLSRCNGFYVFMFGLCGVHHYYYN